MTTQARIGPDQVWPTAPRTRDLAMELYESVASRPLVSVHNGLPARYLADDLPLTNPVSLLIAHDQGVRSLLRASGVDTEFGPVEGWHPDQASRRAFVLLWRHLIEVYSRAWRGRDIEEGAVAAGLPPLRADDDPGEVYDTLALRLHEHPTYPRRLLAGAGIGLFGTSDDIADDLSAHEVLAADPNWTGRVVPTFSPDRYLDPGRRAWCTDADLLAEKTSVDTDDLAGFLEALRQRRVWFRTRGAQASEHHSNDLGAARLATREAGALFRLARTGELLPAEARALQRHLLWEMARMAADDGLAMRLYPPAGFHSTSGGPATEPDDRGVADRVRPLLTDFGSAPNFRLWLFSIDLDAYVAEIVPLAATYPAVTAVPPTRFADDPVALRAARLAAVAALGSSRCLGIVDDMSGPLMLGPRHALGRQLDAGALAEVVDAGQLGTDQAHAALSDAVERAGSGDH